MKVLRYLLLILCLALSVLHAQPSGVSGSGPLVFVVDPTQHLLEAPVEYHDGVMYSNFVKIKLKHGSVIPYQVHDQMYVGTSCISANSVALKMIFDDYVAAAGGDPTAVVFHRENLDDHIMKPVAMDIWDVHLGVMVNLDSMIAELRNNDDIEHVNPPYIIAQNGLPVFDQGQPGNPNALWHISQIQAPDAWVFLQPLVGNPQNVAVADIGQILSSHNELTGKVIYTPTVCTGTGSHATMVASCVTANHCLSSCPGPIGAGRNFVTTSSHSLNCGINAAFLDLLNTLSIPATRKRVINCSWVFLAYQSSPPYSPIGWAPFFQSYNSVNLNTIVLEQLILNGTTVVASAGNFINAPNSCPSSSYCLNGRGVGYPFGLPGVIGVGATAKNYTLNPDFEYGMGSGIDPVLYNTGTTSGGNWNYNYNNPLITNPIDDANQNTGYLDIVAPGLNIDVATHPGPGSTTFGAGTSFAGPIVAGAAASMLLVNPGLTQAQIETILLQTADKAQYNPNGMVIGDLNGTTSFSKGYTYANNGNINAGGFLNPNIDYVMGNGRLNMLSAVMNAAGLNGGGYIVDNTFAVNDVIVNDINKHNYLTGNSYNTGYEYDAILNQNGALVTFRGNTTSMQLAGNATLRILNGATLRFDQTADFIFSPGTGNQVTKCVIGNNGTLQLLDRPFTLAQNTLLEVSNNGNLSITNGTLTVPSGSTLHIRTGSTLTIASTGSIVVQNGGYICIEPGATIVNNGTINLLASIIIGIQPGVNIPNVSNSCIDPCMIIANTIYSGAGSLLFNPNCMALTNISATNVSCLTPNSGTATVAVTGGTPGYTYLWSPGGQTTSTATNLSAGTYTVTVTDAVNATLTATVTVGGPATIATTTASTNVYCVIGLNSGNATVNPSGGSAPYTYLWSNAQTTQTANGLAAGTYSVTVTDAVGCTATATVVVNLMNPPITVATSVNQNVSCNGGNNGSAFASASGGTPGFSYSWSSGSNTPTANSLVAGIYTVTVSDAAYCSATATVSITQPAAVSVTVTPAPATGCLAANGSATANVTGGTGTYTYSWTTSPVQTTQTATGLNPGFYTVTVTDANGCVGTATTQVTSPTTLTVSIAGSNVTCFGLSNGTATANVSGGVPPYSYLWSANTGYQTTQTITGLGPGTYSVTVTDANLNCGQAIVTITAPSNIISTTFTTTYFCSGATVISNPSGGTPPYTYLWSNFQTGQVVTNVPAGSISVVITDANGCMSNAAPYYYGYGTVIPPLPPFIVTTTVTAATGCNTNNGTATVNNHINGTAPYAYLWSNGQTTQTAVNLLPGTYTVTVTDFNGCTTTVTATVPNSNGPTLTITQTNVTCSGGPNSGTATVNPFGGIPPYTYLWSNAQTTQTATGLAAGTYTVVVTDFAGQCNSITVNINPSIPLALSVSKTNPTCVPGGDGTASVNAVFGGTGPYSYLWSNAQITSTATSLNPGTYTVTVTDVNGCQGTATVTISNPGFSVYLGKTDVSCFGGSNGTATQAGFYTTGTPPYSWLWMPGGFTTQTITGLTAGTYTCTVTDAGGCTSTVAVPVGQPAQIVLSTSSTPANCGVSNGTASASVVSGGVGPFSYSWNSVPVQNTPVATNLPGGTYIVTVTDLNGCASTATVTVSQPNNIVLSASSTAAVCTTATGSASVIIVSGGTAPFSYSWNTSPVQNTPTATNIPAGNYTVTVTDLNGCIATATVAVGVSTPAIVLSSTSTPAICTNTNGSASVNVVSGGTAPFSYSWNTSPVQTTQTATNIAGGNYTVTVTDVNGCTATATVAVGVSTPTITLSATSTPVICTTNGSASVNVVSGGTAPFTYSWNTSPVQNTQTATNVPAGNYTVTVTDANGCVATATVAVILTNPTITLSTTSTAAICTTNGSASVNIVSGGTAPFTYSWNTSPVQNTQTATNVPPGNYIVTVTDANGCVATANVSILGLSQVISVSVSSSASTCGFSNGSATVTSVTGGTGPYTYAWSTSPVQTTQTATSLAAGFYSVTVTDVNGCTGSATVGVLGTMPMSPVVTASPSTVCIGGVTTLSVSPALSGINWSPATGLSCTNCVSPTATVNTTTTYTVTGTEPGGCPVSGTVLVTVQNCCAPCAATLTGTVTTSPAALASYCINSNIAISGAVNFTWSEFKIAPNVSITVLPGATLTIEGSHLYSCGNMWSGINVMNGGRVNIVPFNWIFSIKIYPLIEDAFVAVNISSSTLTTNILKVNGATFNRNRVGIQISNYPQNLVNYPFSIQNSIFTCRDLPFTPPLTWPQTPTVKGASGNGVLASPYINDVNYSQTNTAAFLKLPFSGKPYAGIILKDVGFTISAQASPYPISSPTYREIVIGAGGTSLNPNYNVFDNLVNGIFAYASNFTCYNNTFQNIRPTATTAGIGISAQGANKNVRMRVIPTGANNAYINKFVDCSNAINSLNYFEHNIKYCDVRSTQSYPVSYTNPTAEGKIGFKINTNRFRLVEVTNNKLYNIENGVVFNASYGNVSVGTFVSSNGQYSGQLLINKNLICPHLPGNPITTQYVSNAISVLNITPAGPLQILQNNTTSFGTTVDINGNDINNVWRGILCANWQMKNVNTISNGFNGNGSPLTLVPDPTTANPFQYGVNHSNNIAASTFGNYIYYNIVKGYGTTNPNLHGIYTSMCQNQYLTCNNTDQTYNGLIFNSTQSPTSTSKNTMIAHRYGFVLDNGGVIGMQGSPTVPADNIWSGTVTWSNNPLIPPNKTATIFSSASTSVMNVRNSSAYNPNLSGFTTGAYGNDDYFYSGFNTLPGTIWYVANPGIAIGCPILATNGGNGNGSPLGAPPNAASIVSDLEKIALHQIHYPVNHQESEFIAENQLYRTLRADNSLMSNSVILQNFFSQSAGTSRALFTEIEDAVAESDLLTAKGKTAAIIPHNNIENNYRVFYSIYLNYLADTIIDPKDSIALLNLSSACPFIDGPVVYQARALYNAMFDVLFAFTDECSGKSDGSGKSDTRVKATIVEPPKFEVALYPNPANSSVYISPYYMEDGKILVEIKDINGKAVSSQILAVSSGITNFSIDHLNNGVYFLHIINSSNGEKTIKKLVVQK